MGFKTKCVCCSKEVLLKAISDDCYQICSGNAVCKDCAKLIGINNFMQAGFYSKDRVLKMYAKKNPQASQMVDDYFQQKKDTKAKEKQIKRQIQREKNQRYVKRAGCKEMKQEKYTCTNCGASWYINDIDKMKNVYNATTSRFTLNQVKDFSQCPKCRSSASTHKTVKYWVDKKGNCVDTEE